METIQDPLEPAHPFYRVGPDDLRGGRGNLIRSEPLDGYAALDEAGATYRVIYESTSGVGDPRWHGEPIGASGIIAIPGRPRPGGWPVVTWAHGTVGSADKCAPSMDGELDVDPGNSGLPLLRKINKAPHRLLNEFLRVGWVVAMTDYEGLGCYGNHPYLLGDSEGRGVLDIVPAARQLCDQTAGEPTSQDYVIVGHSQGGQAALFAAHLVREGYAPGGRPVGVAALAPASNLTAGLQMLYALDAPYADRGAFYPLFCNGVFAGDPAIDKDQIFQAWALEKYDADYDTKARTELSEDEFWMKRPPLVGIFRSQPWQDPTGDADKKAAWDRYWAQVEAFDPAKPITMPIRISQAAGDERVNPDNTQKLVGDLRDINGASAVEYVTYKQGKVAKPDPPDLGEHFGLLVDGNEIASIVTWAERELQAPQA